MNEVKEKKASQISWWMKEWMNQMIGAACFLWLNGMEGPPAKGAAEQTTNEFMNLLVCGAVLLFLLLSFSLYWNQNQSTHKPKKWVGLFGWFDWFLFFIEFVGYGRPAGPLAQPHFIPEEWLFLHFSCFARQLFYEREKKSWLVFL